MTEPDPIAEAYKKHFTGNGLHCGCNACARQIAEFVRKFLAEPPESKS